MSALPGDARRNRSPQPNRHHARMRGVRSLVVAEHGLVAGLRTQDPGSGRVGLTFPAMLHDFHGNAGGTVAALKIREQRLEGAQVFRSAPKLSE